MASPERVGRDKERLTPERFVVGIKEYKGRSSRLIGIRELRTVGARTPEPFFVATHESFQEYRAQGMTTELEQELLEAFHQIRDANPYRGAFVGWRTESKEGKVPPGPRTSAIDDKNEFLSYVKEAWDFAIKNAYDQGYEVVLALHPFIHANRPPMIEKPRLQWPGGDVTTLPDGSTLIRATFGPDEAVQGFKPDKSVVIIKKQGSEEVIETRTIVANKTQTICPIKGDYIPFPIPPQYQKEQVLNPSQIVAIARTHQEICRRFGPRRFEFIVQAEPEDVVFRECVPFDVKPKDFFFLKKELTLPITVIASESDIAKITPLSAIVHLPAEIFQDRSIIPISIRLANHAKRERIDNLVVLVYGSIATSHMIRRFTDFEQSVLFVDDERLKDGEVVRVFRNDDNKGQWERKEMKIGVIVGLDDVERMQIAAAKARNLSTLREHGIRVPEKGFYIPETEFKKHLAYLELGEAVKNLDKLSGEALRQSCQEIQKAILASKLPDFLIEQIEQKLKEFPDKDCSVRTAEIHEDSKIAQAGIFISGRVPKEEVLKKILECWASGFEPHVIEYLRTSGISPLEIEIGILIHEWIKGKGGVMYTRLSDILITAGLSPAAITSWTGEPSHVIAIGRGTRQILSEKIPPDGPILSKTEIHTLVNRALESEKILGGEFQDFEWVIDKIAQDWILQARPR